jgi:hypothetical protein
MNMRIKHYLVLLVKGLLILFTIFFMRFLINLYPQIKKNIIEYFF